MTIYQKLLKNVYYPVRMGFTRLTGLGKQQSVNEETKAPPQSFYGLEATTLWEQAIKFESYRGKTILIVNVASNCGYTAQYSELEKLYRERKGRNDLVVLGFPSNDFGHQEPGADQEILEFCTVNYLVEFPLFKKAPVTGPNRQKIYEWLSNPALNGWNDRQPGWNFSKYVVSPEGVLLAFYGPAVSPLSEEIRKYLG